MFTSKRAARYVRYGTLLFVLFLFGGIGAAYWYGSQRAAANACYHQAMGVFYSDNPDTGTGGFFLAPLQTTVTRQSYTTYRVESQVVINTGGWSDMLDSFPLKRYTADYVCIAEQKEIMFWLVPWQVEIVQHSTFRQGSRVLYRS